MSEEAVSTESVSESSDSTSTETPVEASQEETSEVTEAQPEVTEGSTDVASEGSEEEAKEPELYDIVVDGETHRLPLEEITKGFQLKSASNKRFQEAAELKKQVEAEQARVKEIEETLLRNPFDALTKANIPYEAIRKHYEDVVYQMLQEDQMSEEDKAARNQQREFERVQKERAELEQKIKELEAAKEQEAFEREVAEQEKVLESQMDQAFEKFKLPKTPKAIQGVAAILSAAYEVEHDMSVEDAVEQYYQESNSAIKELLGSLDEDTLMGIIGDDRMKAIRKKDVESLKNPGTLPSSGQVEVSSPSGDSDSASDFFDNLRESITRR